MSLSTLDLLVDELVLICPSRNSESVVDVVVLGETLNWVGRAGLWKRADTRCPARSRHPMAE